MRTLIAAIVGGLVAFAWGFITHTQLGLTEKEYKPTRNEAALQTAVGGLDGPGVYFVPSCSWEAMNNEAGQKATAEKLDKGPNAMIIRGPDQQKMLDPMQLAMSAGLDVLAALLVALFIGASSSMAGAIPRAIAGGGLGAFAWVSQNAQYWVWYHFPWEFVRAELVNSVVEWTAAALVMALILKAKKKPGAPAPAK
jgi:hypothetical protein